MSDGLTFVCDDNDYSGARQSWYFDSNKKMFYRFNKSGAYELSFEAEHFPNPELLWEERCNLKGVTMNSPDGLLCKPTAATFAMWDMIKDVG
jgi:hypothetical protein